MKLKIAKVIVSAFVYACGTSPAFNDTHPQQLLLRFLVPWTRRKFRLRQPVKGLAAADLALMIGMGILCFGFGTVSVVSSLLSVQADIGVAPGTNRDSSLDAATHFRTLSMNSCWSPLGPALAILLNWYMPSYRQKSNDNLKRNRRIKVRNEVLLKILKFLTIGNRKK